MRVLAWRSRSLSCSPLLAAVAAVGLPQSSCVFVFVFEHVQRARVGLGGPRLGVGVDGVQDQVVAPVG
jgi:hypothetical protein